MELPKNYPKSDAQSILTFSKIEESFIVNSITIYDNPNIEKTQIPAFRASPEQNENNVIFNSPEFNVRANNIVHSSALKSLARTIVFNEFDNTELNDRDDDPCIKHN